MPTPLATLLNTGAKIRFQETYVSEGLNKKLFGVVPSGIVRGGKLATANSGFVVNIDVDSGAGDSVYTYGDRVGKHQLTFRESAIHLLNLAAFAGTTVYIALFVDYSISGTTSVEWRAYTEAELFGGAPEAEAGSVVIVGKVDVPLVGPIPAANVTPERARFAWTDESSGMRAWKQLVENGSFDAGVDGLGGPRSIPHWQTETVAGAPTLTATTTGPRTGLRSLEWNGSGPTDRSAAGPALSAFGGPLTSPLIPTHANQLVHASFWVAGITVPAYTAGVGGVALVLTFYDESAVVLGTVRIETDPASEVGSFGYRQIEGIARAGNGFVSWNLDFNLDLAGGPAVLFVDDVRVFLQSYGDRALEDQGEAGAAVDSPVLSALLSLLPTAGVASVTEKHASRLDMTSFPIAGIAHLFLRLADGTTAPIISPVKSNNADTGVPRFSTDTTGDHVLVWESGYEGAKKLRLYSRGTAPDNGGLEVTANARFDFGTGLWVADDTSKNAHRFSVREDAFRNERKAPPIAAPWADSAWELMSGITGGTPFFSERTVLFENLSSAIPAFASSKVAGDEPSNAANIWKFAFGFPTGDGLITARFFIGDDGTSAGHFALTVNAGWAPGVAQLWSADDPAQPAVRLSARIGAGVTFFALQHKEDTTVAWADASWDVAQALPYPAGPNFGGHFISGEYAYTAARARDFCVNAAEGVSAGASWIFDGSVWKALASAGLLFFPIRIPTGSVLRDVQVQVVDVSAPVTITLIRVDHTPAGVNVVTAVAATASSGAGVRQTKLVEGFFALGEAIVNSLAEWTIVITSGAIDDEIEYVRPFYFDTNIRSD